MGSHLDQDSIVPTNMIEKYINSKEYNSDQTGILSLQYIDRNYSDSQIKKALMRFLKVIL